MTTQLPQSQPRKQPLLISFSGLDGAGKSTQIEHVRALLNAAGYRSELLAFWDNVVVLCRYREGFVQKVYKSEAGIGAPGKPVNRRDKNVRKWYLNLIRHGLYLLDAVHLLKVVNMARRSGADVIIVDRYIYDELANLPLGNPLTRMFIRLVRSFVPRPDLAYLLDADPDAAYHRKPEYPVEFMQESRRAYFRLAELIGGLTVIPPLPLEAAKDAVALALRWVLEANGQPPVPAHMDTAPAA
jgi:thymidylate kinase